MDESPVAVKYVVLRRYHVHNNSTNYTDPLGLAYDFVDWISWQLSMHEFATNPNWLSGLALAYDTVALAPGLPAGAGYVQKLMKTSGATGKAVAKACPIEEKMITVIGHLPDTDVAKNWPGHNVLDIPHWSWEKNVQWLEDAVKRGDEIYIATKKIRPGSIAEREIQYLESLGYVRQGNNMIRKR